MQETGETPTTLLPIAIDLDGTLVATDTLFESIVLLARRAPLAMLLLPLWLTRGLAYFKRAIAQRAGLRVTNLPYREPLLTFLRQERARGRRLVLATAADSSVADAVAQHLNLFDHVLSSDGLTNLKGQAKLQAIRAHLGADFVYAGDSAADLPIWKGCGKAILVGASASIAVQVRQGCEVEQEFAVAAAGAGHAGRINMWLQALRVHQWVKNVLLLVPLFTGFYFNNAGKVVDVLLAFLAFSLVASATYILNDLWDLDNDRQHPRKKSRPLASGRLSIQHGVAGSALLLTCGFALALLLPDAFLGVLCVYVVTTCTYSWSLKEFVLLDVLALSVLYTIRIVAGAVCVRAELSSWLLAFSVFMFFSLALVKRCSELVTLEAANRQDSRGRDYRVTDLVILWPMGVGAALCSTVIFGLFISSPETAARYATPQLLWLSALGLLYWLARLWIKTARGEMHDDPVVFALRDRGSRLTVLGIVGAVLAAHFLSIGGFK